MTLNDDLFDDDDDVLVGIVVGVVVGGSADRAVFMVLVAEKH